MYSPQEEACGWVLRASGWGSVVPLGTLFSSSLACWIFFFLKIISFKRYTSGLPWRSSG